MKNLSPLFFLSFFLNILICSCTQKTNTKKENQNELHLIDSFVDSVSIGKPRNNKIELSKYINQLGKKSFILLKLSEKETNKWKLIYKDTVNSDGLAKLLPEIKDYNSDGVNDLKFCSRIGANLANSIYTVMLYSDKEKRLKKTGKGWNLVYSKKLKMFRERYIASTIYANYYKLQNDSLSKVFEVDLGSASETVKEYDKKGKVIKVIATKRDTVDYKLPKVKHWLRELTIKDSLMN